MLDSLDEIRERFAEYGTKADHEIDLARAALLISKLAFRNLDENECLARLDDMGGRLYKRIGNETDPIRKVAELNRLLYEEEKFQGNLSNYYNPENSFLSRVLELKTGIPITLSLVQMEVGKRAGMDIRGIGLPGHFITAYYHGAGRIFLDAFNQGEILTEGECRRRIADRLGPDREEEAERFLQPVGPRDFLVRILRNLKGIYTGMGKDMLVFQMIHWILVLVPDSFDELRERGLIYESMGNAGMASEIWGGIWKNIPERRTPILFLKN